MENEVNPDCASLHGTAVAGIIGVTVINGVGGAKGSCPLLPSGGIDYAYEQGILAVVAAGNEGTDAQNSTPANDRNVVTVGAVVKDGVRSSFSNYGDKVDLVSLGKFVATVNLEGEVSQMFGTSFAAPVVAEPLVC